MRAALRGLRCRIRDSLKEQAHFGRSHSRYSILQLCHLSSTLANPFSYPDIKKLPSSVKFSCTATHSPHIVVDFSNAISLFVAWIFFVRTIHARLYHYHLTKLILSGCIRDQQNTTHLCLKCSDITQHPWLSSTAGVRSTGNFLVFPAVASPLKAPAVLRYEISLQDPMLIVYVLVSNAGVDVF